MKGGRPGLQSSLCFWRLMTQLAALGCVSDILQTSSPASLPSTFCSLELIQCISDYYVMRQRGRGGWEGHWGAGGVSRAGGERAGCLSGGAGSEGCHSKYSCPPLETHPPRCLFTALQRSQSEGAEGTGVHSVLAGILRLRAKLPTWDRGPL